MAAASDHVDHVKTQLPYALVAGAVALLLFGVFGFLLH
jgi:Na+/H+ antiporter NhaC